MSSIATEDLFEEDETKNDVIDRLVKSVEERTVLRERRSIWVKVKLQEMYDRRTKLEKARLDRLASEGIYIDLDSIRDEIKKTLEIQVELENALIDENVSENLNCDREVESECALDRIIEKNIAESESVLDVNLQKNIEEQQKLSKALEDLKKFSTKPLIKNSKQGKQPVRRNSLTGVNITAPLSEMNGKSPIGRRKSASQERKGMNKSVAKSIPVKRRNSADLKTDRTKFKAKNIKSGIKLK